MKKIFVLFLLWGMQGFASELSQAFCETEVFRKAHVGICILEVESGKELYVRNADQFFVLASLQKVVVSAVATALLGEEYRFQTELAYEGMVDREGVLQGNVWICGGGDPTLSLEIFSVWEKALKKEGIRKINGKIIADSSCFESTLASPYWYYEDLGNYYGAGACGLSIHQNLYFLTFQPGKKGGAPASVMKCEPQMFDLITHNEVTTGPAGSGDQVWVFGSEYSPVQFYRGTVPIDRPTFTVKAANPDPALFCAKALASRIEASQGVEVVRERLPMYPQRKVISSKKSPSLKEIVKETNIHSINLYAEHLFKAIGGGTAKGGKAKVEQFLRELGAVFQVQDGSGLSRGNLVTPKGFALLLCQLRKDPMYRSIYNSFPQPEKTGTLLGFPKLANGSLRAKTGSMSNIYNLGGYFTMSSGKEYAFCICCNNYAGPLSQIREEMALFLNVFSKEK